MRSPAADSYKTRASSVESASPSPRVGVPYRTLNEQLTNKRDSYDKYLDAIRRRAASQLKCRSIFLRGDLAKLIASLDAIRSSGRPRRR